MCTCLSICLKNLNCLRKDAWWMLLSSLKYMLSDRAETMLDELSFMLGKLLRNWDTKT